MYYKQIVKIVLAIVVSLVMLYALARIGLESYEIWFVNQPISPNAPRLLTVGDTVEMNMFSNDITKVGEVTLEKVISTKNYEVNGVKLKAEDDKKFVLLYLTIESQDLKNIVDYKLSSHSTNALLDNTKTKDINGFDVFNESFKNKKSIVIVYDVDESFIPSTFNIKGVSNDKGYEVSLDNTYIIFDEQIILK